MDVLGKKRDQKARDKKNDGTVSFSYDRKKSTKKGGEKTGFKKGGDSSKKVGEKRPFTKDPKKSNSPYQNRDGKKPEKGDDKTHS